MRPVVWSPERDVPRRTDVGWLFWGTYALVLLVLAWVGLENAREVPTPEVGTLQAIDVQMSDPLPCEQDPELRITYQRHGVFCRPWPPPRPQQMGSWADLPT